MKLNTLSKDELKTLMRDKRKVGQPIICWHCDKHPATDVHHLDGNHRNDAPENLAPWDKRCHNEEHGISDSLTSLSLMTRMLYTVQDVRKAMGNRVGAYQRLGYDVDLANETFDELATLEKHTEQKLVKMLKHERDPCYTLYLSRIKGVGPKIAAVLLSEIGDPGKFDTVSALWAYAGLDVRDGKARKRRRGETANWNNTLRSTCAKKLTDQFIKLKGHDDCFGRVLYDRFKTFYTERDGGKPGADGKPLFSKGHIDNRARRKVAKIFLSCLWVAWRQTRNLSVTEPYAAAKLGHTHIITPEDWVGEGWLDSYQPMLEAMRQIDEAAKEGDAVQLLRAMRQRKLMEAKSLL